MASYNRRVHVSGIPANVHEDDLLSFFQSRILCPSGGQVENVELQSQTAIVTFCRSAGISRDVLFLCSVKHDLLAVWNDIYFIPV